MEHKANVSDNTKLLWGIRAYFYFPRFPLATRGRLASSQRGGAGRSNGGLSKPALSSKIISVALLTYCKPESLEKKGAHHEVATRG